MAPTDQPDDKVADPFLQELKDSSRQLLQPFDSEEGWAALAPRMTTGARRPSKVALISSRGPWRAFMVSASALVLVLFVPYFGYQWLLAGANHTYATTPGQHMSLVLVDGTRVTLGPASHLQLMGDYGHGTRQLALDGEAYFAVVHDEQHPFAVRARGATIRDVGTEFDVRAYGDDRDLRVAVAQGAVAVEGVATRPTLTAGDLATIDAEGVTITHHGDVAAMTAWVQGGLVFDNATLPTVVRELARTFDLAITIADTTLASQTLTARFESGSADEILDEITRVIGAQYERHGRHVVIRRSAKRAKQNAADPKLPLVRTARANTSQE